MCYNKFMTKAALSKELDYYIAHQSELVEKYDGRYVVIVGKKIVGVFDSIDQAISSASEKYQLGKFLVHLVGSGKENYTVAFHSRVAPYETK